MKNKTHQEVIWVKRRAYKGLDLSKIIPRPGSLAMLSNPSRVANTYFYPDGRVLTEEQRSEQA
jgi:hypothetical protein